MGDKKHNLSESQEDYLEAVYDLISERGKATVSEIAGRVSVAKPSVVKALKRLKKLKLVAHEPYGDIELTLAGLEKAELIRLRHNTLVYFLTDFLGVGDDMAEADACALEHHLCACSTERLLAFIKLNDENVVRVVEGENFEIGSFIKRNDRPAREKTKGEKRKNE
ncbi:MAG: metal-dependent transcriptional regulator [Candidatus Coatesbacteria bacterium]|nr:MAG: metal-dependent transcriptional regulator [Candidatus Coatesbacteria bacterium]